MPVRLAAARKQSGGSAVLCQPDGDVLLFWRADGEERERVGVRGPAGVSFSLPALTPPDAIQKKTVPPDSDALLAAVRRYVESRTQICGPLNVSASAIIPKSPFE